MASTAPNRLIASKSAMPLYGRTDGVGVVPDAGGDSSLSDGLVAISNGDVSKTLDHSMYCEVFEDFIGQTAIPLNGTGDASSGPWQIKDTSAAGAPTTVVSGDADNGQLALAFAADNEAEILTLYWGDEQNIDSDQEPVFDIRLSLDAQFTAGTILVFGLASAYNATADSVANHGWFRVEGANLNLLIESDDATTDDDDNDTTVDLVAATMYEFRVSLSALHGGSATNAKFFYRSTLGGDWTPLLATTTFSVGADIALQPIVQLQKASGTATDGIKIDYVRAFWKRN